MCVCDIATLQLQRSSRHHTLVDPLDPLRIPGLSTFDLGGGIFFFLWTLKHFGLLGSRLFCWTFLAAFFVGVCVCVCFLFVWHLCY